MGTKGDKRTQDATDAAARLVDDLAPLGEVTSKSMFGGYGISESGIMFALIDSAGVPHFRVDQTTEETYVEAGSSKHARMPYWSVPEDALSDNKLLIERAKEALDVARRAKKL